MNDEIRTILGAVIPVFGIVVAGLVIRRLKWLNEEADQSLLRVNINLLFPCLILDAALGNPALGNWRNLLLAPAVGFGGVGGGMVLAWFCARAMRLGDAKTRGTFAVTAGIQNYSYVPLPLAMLLFDSGTTGVLFIHTVGVEVAMWTLGVMLFAGAGAARDWRKIINAPVVAIVLSLVLNALKFNTRVPTAVLMGAHWLGQCAVPMALILVGAVVADHLHEFHSASSWRVIGAAVLVRIGLLPVLILLMAKVIPASLELKRVMVLQAAMPSAVFPIVMSRHYGGEPSTALRVVIGTAVVGLVTIPLWIRAGMAWLGL